MRLWVFLHAGWFDSFSFFLSNELFTKLVFLLSRPLWKLKDGAISSVFHRFLCPCLCWPQILIHHAREKKNCLHSHIYVAKSIIEWYWCIDMYKTASPRRQHLCFKEGQNGNYEWMKMEKQLSKSDSDGSDISFKRKICIYLVRRTKYSQCYKRKFIKNFYFFHFWSLTGGRSKF